MHTFEVKITVILVQTLKAIYKRNQKKEKKHICY